MNRAVMIQVAVSFSLAACSLPGAGGAIAPAAGSLVVQTARVHVDPARALDVNEDPTPAAAAGPFLTLTPGHATRLRKPSTGRGLLLALATPTLEATSQDVDLRLDGAAANEPLAPEGALDDAVLPAPACALPAVSADGTAAGYRTLATPAALGDDTAFWVIRAGLPAPRGQAFDEVLVPCHRVAAGTHAQVYLDARLAQDVQARAGAQAVLDAFDQQIYATVTRIFGPAPQPGLNGDGRVLVVITSEVSGSGQTPTLAYFGRRDLSAREPGVPAHVHSNEREILFVDASTLDADHRPQLLTAVSHEFEHLVNFHHKAGLAHLPKGEAVWLDEALAMYASAACGYGVNESRTMYQHVASYLSRPYKYSLTDWAGNPGGQGYGMGYMFMAYMADRFGQDLVTDLVASPKTGKANLEEQLAKRGSSYAGAFADWAVELANDGLYPDDRGRFTSQGLHPRGTTPFGELKGPAAIRVGPAGAHLPHRTDVAYLFHFQPGPDADPVLRSAGGPFAATAIVP